MKEKKPEKTIPEALISNREKVFKEEPIQRMDKINTRNDITPLLGIDWLKKFKLTIGNIRLDEKSQSEKRRIIEKFPEFFRSNTTIKDAETNIQLKPGHYPVKQKERSIPLHLQAVEKRIETLMKSGHLEKMKHVDEDCFVSPVVITVKCDKSVKLALD